MKLLLEIWIDLCDTNFRCENLMMDQLWGIIKIKRVGLISLTILMVAVWIPGWMCAKGQGCKWNISVLKNSLKTAFVVFR